VLMVLPPALLGLTVGATWRGTHTWIYLARNFVSGLVAKLEGLPLGVGETAARKVRAAVGSPIRRKQIV
jgi:hypothetical protein